jgi:hypothetical protein
MSRGALVLLPLLGAACLLPPEQWGVVAPEQHLVALEYPKAGYRERSLRYAVPKGCSDAAWEFDRWVFQNVDCRADADCVVLSGVEVLEVNRVAARRCADREALGRAASTGVRPLREHYRVGPAGVLSGTRCALRAPSRSRLSPRGFDP